VKKSVATMGSVPKILTKTFFKFKYFYALTFFCLEVQEIKQVTLNYECVIMCNSMTNFVANNYLQQ
jgi:hypothetical protein